MFEELANEARHRIVSKRLGPDDLVSMLEHPRREDLACALATDARSMERALINALKPVALDHDFCDIHIGERYPAFFSWTRDKILETFD